MMSDVLYYVLLTFRPSAENLDEAREQKEKSPPEAPAAPHTPPAPPSSLRKVSSEMDASVWLPGHGRVHGLL